MTALVACWTISYSRNRQQFLGKPRAKVPADRLTVQQARIRDSPSTERLPRGRQPRPGARTASAATTDILLDRASV